MNAIATPTADMRVTTLNSRAPYNGVPCAITELAYAGRVTCYSVTIVLRNGTSTTFVIRSEHGKWSGKWFSDRFVNTVSSAGTSWRYFVGSQVADTPSEVLDRVVAELVKEDLKLESVSG